MSKEEQIESLIHEIRLGVMKGGIGWRTVQIAEQLYDAGYRKQSEGTWEKSDIPGEKYVCSECGGACWYYDFECDVAKSKFCPNCGAKMKGGVE